MGTAILVGSFLGHFVAFSQLAWPNFPGPQSPFKFHLQESSQSQFQANCRRLRIYLTFGYLWLWRAVSRGIERVGTPCLEICLLCESVRLTNNRCRTVCKLGPKCRLEWLVGYLTYSLSGTSATPT